MPISYALGCLFLRLRIAYSLISLLQRSLRELQKAYSPNEQPVSVRPVLDHTPKAFACARHPHQVVNRRGCIHRDLVGELPAAFSRASWSAARSESNSCRSASPSLSNERSLYVYPNSPAALNVLVDQAFNLPQASARGAFLLNTAASSITVSLTAPGSNSYYASIYWDVTTNSARVIYGAMAVSPTPVLPDPAYPITLAVVLLTTGQSTVVATNISDVRSVLPQVPVMSYTATTGTSFSVNCKGADRVIVHIGASRPALRWRSTTCRLAKLSRLLSQTLRGNSYLKVAANTQSGLEYTLSSKVAGTAGSFTKLYHRRIRINDWHSLFLYGHNRMEWRHACYYHAWRLILTWNTARPAHTAFSPFYFSVLN